MMGHFPDIVALSLSSIKDGGNKFDRKYLEW